MSSPLDNLSMVRSDPCEDHQREFALQKLNPHYKCGDPDCPECPDCALREQKTDEGGEGDGEE